MSPERLIKHTIDVAKTLGEYVLYQIRSAETPPTTPASIQFYTTGEAEE